MEKAPVKAYEQWNVVGVGILGTSFSGEQAYIDSESPSVGYETASGANNVLLDSEDSEFSFGPVGTKPIPALFCLLVFWGKRMVDFRNK